MPTTGPAADQHQIDIDDEYLKTYHLLWLDSNVNVKGTRDTEQKLRSVINHLKKFQDTQQCLQYIQQTSKKDRLVLIVSGQLGQGIVPFIHEFRHVISIYVYGMEKKKNELWTSTFPKVKSVVVGLDELICRIKEDYKIQQKIEEPSSINIFITDSEAGTSTIRINGKFVHFRLLMDCLSRLKSTTADRNELIDYYKNKYEGNDTELNNLRQFEADYSCNNILQWYTKESFFYKNLNTALRTQNIHMMFLFREFIFDIQSQLQKYQSATVLQVYRSQLMSANEVENLNRNIGQLGSVNSFFSTSKDREIALFRLGDTTVPIDSKRVLFEIEADPKLAGTKSFADISNFSAFPNESEVLFMTGSIFRLESIHYNDDRIWIIRMTLCSDDEHDLKQDFMRMKRKNGSGNTNLRSLGKVVWRMGKLDLADKYLNRFLKQLPPNDPLLGIVYEDLGELASQREDYAKSIYWDRKSFAIENQNQSTVNYEIDNTNDSIEQQISANTKWNPHGITITGGKDPGNGLDQLKFPAGVWVSKNGQSFYIADCYNDRIMEWILGENIGRVVAGGNGRGNRLDQLNGPRYVVVDEKNGCLIICDNGNRRVVRCPLQNGTHGEVIISDIDCSRLTIDNNGNIYVSDSKKNEVRRWTIGDKNGAVVAGGNREEDDHDQLDRLTYIFVGHDHSVYVSDWGHHCVMKWEKGATQGVIVAGGQGEGNSPKQLSHPQGVFVDQLENVYVVDSGNHRIMRWKKGSKEGSIVVGGNGQGVQSNQLHNPEGLSFDRKGNLYVVDCWNNRVQKYLIDSY